VIVLLHHVVPGDRPAVDADEVVLGPAIGHLGPGAASGRNQLGISDCGLRIGKLIGAAHAGFVQARGRQPESVSQEGRVARLLLKDLLDGRALGHVHVVGESGAMIVDKEQTHTSPPSKRDKGKRENERCARLDGGWRPPRYKAS